MKHRYVVLDLETTGNSPKKERIIQVGAVLIENGEITERFASFVNPRCAIPPFIEQLTGISNELVQNAPTFDQIAPMLLEMLEGSSLVAHNVPFDLSFLQYELKENGYSLYKGKAIDTVELSRILMPTQDSYKLTDLASYYSFEHENPHRADSDAEVTAYIFLELLNKIEQLPTKTVKKLRKLCKRLKSDVYYVFRQMETKELDVEEYHLYESIIIKKLEQDRNEQNLLASETMDDKQCETDDFSSFISNLLLNREHAIVEIPKEQSWKEEYIKGIINFIHSTNERVLISTYNNQLQNTLHKLICKDNRVTSSFIKDKKNYINIDRFIRSLHANDDNYDSILTKAQILVWLTETETGDVEELSLTSGGRLLWDTINCLWHGELSNAPIDYYEHSILLAKKSDVIITNHPYFIETLNSNEPIVDVEYVIMEESQSFISSFRRSEGVTISYLKLHLILTRLKTMDLVENAKEELNESFTLLRDYCLLNGKLSTSKAYYLYPQNKLPGDGWEAIQEAIQRLLMRISDLILYLERYEEEYVVTINELKIYQEALRSVIFHYVDGTQTWLEADVKGAKNAVVIKQLPVIVSNKLAINLFQNKSSVILFDHAMEADDQFQLIVEEIGLEDFYPTTRTYLPLLKHNATIHIPDDVPLVSEVTEEVFVDTIALQVNEIALTKGGRVIVSFSSIKMLSNVYEQLKEYGDGEKYVIVSQSSNSGSKQRILKSIANFEQVVILVTHQFLEEVSIDNEEIETLIVVRLPFCALDEPMMAAKIKMVENEGRNSFSEVSLPTSLIRYKWMLQNFINYNLKQDIIILDGRLIHKRYGEKFLQLLPNLPVNKCTFYSMLQNFY